MAPHAGADDTGDVFVRARPGQSALRVTGSSLIATSAFKSAHSVLHSTAFAVVQDVFLLLAIVFWFGLAFWVYRDARRRMDDPWLWGTATALGVVVPYVGPLIYMLFRPPETLEDLHSREVELRALEAHLDLNRPHCPLCRTEVEPEFLVCPVCTTQLKRPCGHCNAPLEPRWHVCPYCATPVVAEPAVRDLDAALTAEVAVNGNGKKPRRRAKTVA